MNQMVGHLDFFPNGGENMPGCKKNVLSQIMNIDGVWEGEVGVQVGGQGRESLPRVSSAWSCQR